MPNPIKLSGSTITAAEQDKVVRIRLSSSISSLPDLWWRSGRPRERVHAAEPHDDVAKTLALDFTKTQNISVPGIT
jgi:hypothetical protein